MKTSEGIEQVKEFIQAEKEKSFEYGYRKALMDEEVHFEDGRKCWCDPEVIHVKGQKCGCKGDERCNDCL